MSSEYTIGVDIGGTKVAVGLCDRNGLVGPKTVRETGEPKEVVEQIEQVMEESDCDYRQLAGIGIGSVGPLNLEKGLVLDPVNIPHWKNVPLRKLIHESFNLPTYLDNDANVAAIAEKELGVQSDNLIYITVSTGIGGGIINDGSVVHGKGNAGEIGHMVILPLPYGPLCSCGKRGCLEALASGTAIAKRGRELLGIDDSAKAVFEQARQDDPVAQRIIKDAAHFLGVGIGNLMEIFDPQYIVLGGGVTESWDLMEDTVRSSAEVYSRTKVTITLTTLGADIGLVGAAMLPFARQ